MSFALFFVASSSGTVRIGWGEKVLATRFRTCGTLSRGTEALNIGVSIHSLQLSMEICFLHMGLIKIISIRIGSMSSG
jgi:hypothetical protein